jgi:hypothetical protein
VRQRTSLLTGERVRVYRTVPARVIGWTMVGGAAVLTVLTVLDMVSGAHRGLAWPSALVTAVAAAAWALFLRPHVELRTDGVVLANIVTDTTVPFAAVEKVTDRWAVELHDTQGRRYSSWAVPVRREWVRRTRIDDFAETTRRRGSGGVTAQGVVDEVQRALQRWRLDGGELAASAARGGPAQVTQRVSWSSAAVLALAAGLLVVAVLG